MTEPLLTKVRNFVEITNVSHEKAKQWLQAHDYETEKAVNAYFNDPDALVNQDVSWLTAYLDFLTEDPQAPSHGGPCNSLGPGVFQSAAPSRPPSRTSVKEGDQPPAYRDGTYNILGSYSPALTQSVAVPSEAPLKDREDRESQDINNPPHPSSRNPQYPSTTTFGPSTRSDQETQGWIIDVATTSTKEVVLTPEPQERERANGAPSYLRPAPDKSLIPALLKILHSIPMAREALLNRTLIDSDYGYEERWWSGDSILSQSMNAAADTNILGHINNHDPFLHELQRLMAFLCGSRRAYGSADSLINIGNLRAESPTDTAKAFLDAWHDATRTRDSGAPLLDIFLSVAKRSYTSSEAVEHSFTILPVKGDKPTLYEIMDDMLWFDGNENEWEDTVLTRTGQVMCFHITQGVTDSPCGVRVPATLFLDRYMLRAAPKMNELRRKQDKIRKQIEVIKRKRDTILECEARSSRLISVDARELISRVIHHIEKTGTHKALDSSLDVEVAEVEGNDLISELKDLTGRIEAQLALMDKSMEYLAQQLAEFSTTFVKFSDDTRLNPRHGFSLRGVIISHNTLFMLEHADHIDEDLVTQRPLWVWWEIRYDKHAPKPVSCTKVREIEVLKAVRDSSAPFLVYASEEAMSYPSTELPAPLKVFVQTDNAHFQSELRNGQSEEIPAFPT